MSNIKSHLDVVVFDTLPEKVSYEIFKDFFLSEPVKYYKIFLIFFFLHVFVFPEEIR